MRIRIHNGLDIPLVGAPEQKIVDTVEVQHVALNGLDYQGLKPRMMVAEGDRVCAGQALFIDKRDPAVRYAAPGTGSVVAVNRGPRRVLETVVVKLDSRQAPAVDYRAWSDREIQAADRSDLVRQLLESGLWTSFRTRPFSRVPASADRPRSLFVTAMDTQPMAADPTVVIRTDAEAFNTGLMVLSRVISGPVWLCTSPGWDIPLPDIERLRRVEFEGPHPAGLAGTHIHFLDPVGAGGTVWHIGYQDVISIGALFRSGTVHHQRVVALAGEPLARPRLVRTHQGANTDELLERVLDDRQNCRVISGSVLSGRTAVGSKAYLGRYHNQLSILREGGPRRLLGWLGVFSGAYSAVNTIMNRSGQRRRALTTAQNGRCSGMLPLRVFEQVLPLDILPSLLFRALLVKDTDRARALGCLELDEEDLALCSFVCPAKVDYGSALRINLDQIEKEG